MSDRCPNCGAVMLAGWQPCRPVTPPVELCERHPDCLFQGGCDCKREARRKQGTGDG